MILENFAKKFLNIYSFFKLENFNGNFIQGCAYFSGCTTARIPALYMRIPPPDLDPKVT